eukprot:scaffold219_cov119-Skeletonema_dohrnii-CCMP3373.AAC.10
MAAIVLRELNIQAEATVGTGHESRAASFLVAWGMVCTYACFELTRACKEQRLAFSAMVSRKRNKWKERRALKAEKERVAKAEVIQKDYFPPFVQEEAAKVDGAEKNSFGSEDISYDEAEELGSLAWTRSFIRFTYEFNAISLRFMIFQPPPPPPAYQK